MSADDENRFRPKPGRIRSDAPKGGKTKSFLTQAKKIARQHSTTSSRSSPRPGKTPTAKGGKGARSTGGPGVRRGRGAAFVADLGFVPARAYPDWRAMLAAEAARQNLATPALVVVGSIVSMHGRLGTGAAE